MITSAIRKTVTAFLSAALLLGVVAQGVSAQDTRAETEGFFALYREHASAGFVVEWPVSAGGVNALRARLGRYAYLAFYTSPAQMTNQPLPLVSLGFFVTRAEAEKFVLDNASVFTGLRVLSVSAEQHRQLFTPTEQKSSYWLNPATEDRHAGVQAILAEAKNLFTNQQYQRALNYYAVLSLSSDVEISAWAQELMGLTYERLGQTELALQSYRTLLASRAEGSWVKRVNQRLRALETAADDGQDALRKSKYAQTDQRFYWRGVLGQFYNYMERGGKYVRDEDVFAVVATNYDFTAGYRHPEHNIEVRLSGYDHADLLDHVDDDKTAIKRFYLDYTHVDTGLNLVGGRQRDYDSGTYTYFDGLSVKYPLSQRWKVGFNAGVPVLFSDFYDYMDREFYSLQTSFDWNANWSVAGYVTQQTVYGETDRAAYGGRAQYVSQRFSSYVNVDYDYEFAELNVLRWQGSYQINESNRVAAQVGRQRSPFLTSTNILIGQPYLNLEQYLRTQFNRDYLLYHALERTSLFEYGSLNYQWQVDSTLQIMVDLYQSVSSDMPLFEVTEVDLMEAKVESKDAEYRYSSAGVQAIVDDFFGVGDSATLGVRVADTTQATSSMIHIGERFRLFGNRLFVTPKVHFKYDQRKADDTAQTNVRGSLALAYRPWRNTELRLEAGNEAIRDVDTKNSLDYSYVFAGYHLRF
ncbi:MAG: hypothetical protein NVV73_16710 [Cellvibrionaceae bacterium]|nr:hypothetical protein [Cellvibrionaceae bacterium]